MSGRYVQLEPGRYTLSVSEGEGPAGVHRNNGHGDVRLDVHGGRMDFIVDDEEHAYYWWRGPEEPTGVRLMGVSSRSVPSSREARWPTGTTG